MGLLLSAGGERKWQKSERRRGEKTTVWGNVNLGTIEVISSILWVVSSKSGPPLFILVLDVLLDTKCMYQALYFIKSLCSTDLKVQIWFSIDWGLGGC